MCRHDKHYEITNILLLPHAADHSHQDSDDHYDSDDSSDSSESHSDSSNHGDICCPHLSHITNGYVRYYGVYPGSIAKYCCKKGYILEGKTYRKCLSSGKWSGEEPKCKKRKLHEQQAQECVSYIGSSVSLKLI